jgi:hypothetical protein
MLIFQDMCKMDIFYHISRIATGRQLIHRLNHPWTDELCLLMCALQTIVGIDRQYTGIAPSPFCHFRARGRSGCSRALAEVSATCIIQSGGSGTSRRLRFDKAMPG